MRPEDIDKLFKERLGNTSPTPPGDLWNRLQNRMEAEMPQATPLQPKEERRSFMWLYSSVAATASLVLTVGVVFFNIKTSTPEISETIAEKDHIEISETPIIIQPAPETIAQANVQTEKTSEEKNITPQATNANTAASKSSEEVVKTESIARATPKAVQRKPARVTATTQPQATAQQAIAANTTAEATETATAQVVKPVTTSAAFATSSADMNAEPVEIIIKRSVASQSAMAEADAPGDVNKKAQLAKNIFKQVRNLASGDGVELSELGINADRVALNTQVGKQKFSKVINL
jgi:cytoskeletal protein RodZ